LKIKGKALTAFEQYSSLLLIYYYAFIRHLYLLTMHLSMTLRTTFKIIHSNHLRAAWASSTC